MCHFRLGPTQQKILDYIKTLPKDELGRVFVTEEEIGVVINRSRNVVARALIEMQKKGVWKRTTVHGTYLEM